MGAERYGQRRQPDSSNVGNPWWTFQPELVFSYLKDGWNLTANLLRGNQHRGTRSPAIVPATSSTPNSRPPSDWQLDVRAGGLLCGQVTDDKSSAFYRNAINVNRYNNLGGGGLVGYDFGPAGVDGLGHARILGSRRPAARRPPASTPPRSPRAIRCSPI